MPSFPSAAAASALVLALLTACGGKPATPVPVTPATTAASIRGLVTSEELILSLSPQLASVDTSTLPLRPTSPATSIAQLPGAATTVSTYTEPQTTTLARPLTNPKLSIVSGSFTTPDTFQTTISLASPSLTATFATTWSHTPDTWAPTSWRTLEITTYDTPRPLFSNALPAALPVPNDLEKATTSLHRKILIENYFGGKPADLPPGLSDSRFYPDSLNIHPALSVVDINDDGYDDLYLCVRWGPNLLFVNNCDSTFTERAASYGLDLNGRSTSATFADFDNDGDPDLVLGRSLEKSLYLVNHDGQFKPADPQPAFPSLVTSTTTADVNRDGLLDVFFTTYSPLDINARTTDPGALPEWASHFLTPADATEVARRNAAAPHPYLAQVGPPDQLFVNTGHNTFTSASPELAGFTNAFQSAWADIDRDGDPDLYIATDFSPDRLYRNDTPTPGAPPTFTDITPKNHPMGFGMGVAFADIDNDTAPELYLSNMYSKAGRRITAQLPGLDPKLAQSAAGNRLFRIAGDGTLTLDQKLTSQTANAQWSWGGGFADFDNDTFLDLYVPAGFYTAPEEFAVPVDL